MVFTLDGQLKGSVSANAKKGVKVSTTQLQVWPWSRLAINSKGSGVIYYVDNNSNLLGRTIDPNGKLAGPSFKAFNSPKQNAPFYFQSAAFSTTAKGTRGILVAGEDEDFNGNVPGWHPSMIWAQTVDESGKPLGSPVGIYKTSQNETLGVAGILDVAKTVALPASPSDASSHFIWFGAISQVQAPWVYVKTLKINLAVN